MSDQPFLKNLLTSVMPGTVLGTKKETVKQNLPPWSLLQMGKRQRAAGMNEKVNIKHQIVLKAIIKF